MNVHNVSLKRMLGFWFACFAVNYVSGMLLYTFYQIAPNPFVFMAMFVAAPLTYLLFSWLYLRKVSENDWSMRFLVAAVWVCLSVVGAALLMMPVYGYPWTIAFSPSTLRGQLINVSAILVAGWASRK